MSYPPRPAVGAGPRQSPSVSGNVGSKRGPPSVTGPGATGPGGGGGSGGVGTGVGGGTGGGAGGSVPGGTGPGGISQPPRLKAPGTGHMVGSVGQPSKSNPAYRSVELCDALKHEINSIVSEIGRQQQDREDYEKKFRQQIAEMDRIQRSLKQLKDDHMAMKQHYEEEIVRLQRKLDQTHKGESDGRIGSNSVQGASGGMSMGSTGPGKSYSISPQEPQGGGMKDLVGIVGSSLPSPRKKHAGPGPASLPVPMPGGPVRVGSGGHHVVLPGMPGRGRVPDDEYGVGVDRTMRPNGHAMEPLNKRIRLPDPLRPGGVFRPPHGSHRHDPPPDHHHHHQLQQQQQHRPSLEGPGGLRDLSVVGAENSHRLAEPLGVSGGIDYRGPGGPAPGMGPGSLSGSSKVGSGTGGGSGGGSGVDIPDAIPAELNYQVRYEGDIGADRDRGSAGGRRGAGELSVELAKAQDLRSVVCCVRFSTDGTKVAAGCHSCVKVFDVFTFRQLYVCRKQLQEAQGHPEADPYVRAVCFSPDGRSIVAGMEKNSARVLLLEEDGGRQGAITLSDHESEVYSLDWVSTMIASGSGDGRIRLWHSVTGALQASLGDVAGPQDGVTSVVLKHDTSMVAAASIDRIVHVWSTQTHKLLHRLDGHTESVYAVTFSHDGNTLVSGGLDKTIKVWDLGPGSAGRLSPHAQTLPGGHSNYVLSVCFSQDGKYIISGSKDRSVTIWDAKLMKRVATITGFKNSVIGVSASPTKDTFATGSGDNLVCVWNFGERSVAAPPASSSSNSGGGGASNSSDGGAYQRRGTSSMDTMDVCSSKESDGKGAGVDKAKGGVDGKGSGGGTDGRKRGSGAGDDGGREAAMERDGKTSTSEEDGQRSSVFGEKNKSSVTVGDSKEGPAPRDGHPAKSVSSSSGVGGGGYEGAMVALRRRSPVHSDVRAGNGHGHGYGHGSIHSERDRERVREGRGAVGDDHDKRGGGGGSSSTQDRRRREDAGDRSPKKRAAATVASMAVSGGGGRSGRGGSGSGGHVGSEGGLSPERRSLPPKKDIQRRDSPPTPES